MNVCAFTSICEEDALWIPLYLQEMERLQLPFVVHFDRCSHGTHQAMLHPMLAGWVSQNDPAIEFDETHKQGALDKVAALGYAWAFAVDIDETFELDAAQKIAELTRSGASGPDWIDVRWLNLWGDKHHIRVDRGFGQGHRVKLYNLKRGDGNYRWVYDHPITNGPKLVFPDGPGPEEGMHADLVCLHWGMMTPQLRRQHKARWDRIYSTALRGDPNPYGFWREAIETEAEAVVVRHGYFG